MSRLRVHKIIIYHLIISLCRFTAGELTIVKPQKAVMIPEEDLVDRSYHIFENNIAGLIR